MEIVYERCAGLDVHKKNVKACFSGPGADGQRSKETRTYLTMTQNLLEMRDWLKEQGCTHIALEATGVYWKPIYNLLEGDFEILVVNAHHIKTVPGRKTDVKDAEWIADLLAHGLLSASFIPSAPQRELRELTRYRTSLVEERAREVNRLQKTLEDTNLKLGDVVSDVMGKAAQLILHAVVEGETDPGRLASLAVGRVHASPQDLERALTGKVTAHHRFMLGQHLQLIEHLDEAIKRVNEELARRFTPPEPPTPQEDPPQPAAALVPPLPESALPSDSDESAPLSWQEAVELIDQVTGISQRVAQGLLAEIGLEMDQFPSAKHLASWVGICPGNHESAGKRLSGKTRKGNPYARRLLIQAAHAAAHSKNTYLAAQYRRIAARRGPKRAAVAVGHSILVIVYHLLRDRGTYHDLGGNYFDEHDRQMVQKHLVRRLERLGYQINLQPRSEAG
jgi:transposase